MAETAYPMPSETRAQYHFRTRWVPAAIYVAAATALIAVAKLIGI